MQQKRATELVQDCRGIVAEHGELKARAEASEQREKDLQEKLRIAVETEDVLKNQLAAYEG